MPSSPPRLSAITGGQAEDGDVGWTQCLTTLRSPQWWMSPGKACRSAHASVTSRRRIPMEPDWSPWQRTPMNVS